MTPKYHRLLKISLPLTAVGLLGGCVDNYSFAPGPVAAPQIQTPAPLPSDGLQVTLRKYKPALAVRGAQCMVCHASLQANLITDFGYGSPNFLANPYGRARSFVQSTQIGIDAHHTNESAYTNQREAWQSAIGIVGQIFVPKVQLTDDQVEAMTGVRTSLSFRSLMEDPTLTGTGPMVSQVTPPAGITEKIVEADAITISAPTTDEILALLTPAGRASALAVEPLSLHSDISSVAQNFVTDSVRSVIRNDFTSPTLVCRGDVLVKGTLLLKNAVIATDKNGCRLYVTEGIHVQGTLTLTAPAGDTPNLQLSSAKAILLGFDADSMGHAPGGGRVDTRSTITGRLARFATRLDTMYDPSVAPIAGVSRSAYFDGLVDEAVRLGDYLKDAVESATANEVPTGASIVGGRLAVNYSHLLLNAPEVHSRYFGDIEGAVIADVAFLARNPAGVSLEHFVYDSVFDTAPAILPALPRAVLRVK